VSFLIADVIYSSWFCLEAESSPMTPRDGNSLPSAFESCCWERDLQFEAEERVYWGCGWDQAADEWRVYVERRRRLLALVN